MSVILLVQTTDDKASRTFLDFSSPVRAVSCRTHGIFFPRPHACSARAPASFSLGTPIRRRRRGTRSRACSRSASRRSRRVSRRSTTTCTTSSAGSTTSPICRASCASRTGRAGGARRSTAADASRPLFSPSRRPVPAASTRARRSTTRTLATTSRRRSSSTCSGRRSALAAVAAAAAAAVVAAAAVAAAARAAGRGTARCLAMSAQRCADAGIKGLNDKKLFKLVTTRCASASRLTARREAKLPRPRPRGRARAAVDCCSADSARAAQARKRPSSRRR
jgi:hypothetical protein